MKAEADLHFLIGTNQIIGHGWPYSPPQVGEPGWSLYAAAVFNDNNPWHAVMPDVTRYIQRISYLLRQGEPANQVALLLPTDDAWANFSPGKVTVTGEMAHLITPALMSAILSAGYNVDFIDADTINRQGIPHPILVIPPTTRIPAETEQHILAYGGQGGHVIYLGHAPTQNADGSSLTVTWTSPGLNPDSFKVVPDEAHLTEALHTAAPPDLKLPSTDPAPLNAIGFIRRKLPNADIYFVVNTGNQPLHTTAAFATRYRAGHVLNPETGEAEFDPIYPEKVKLDLAPYESRVFYFYIAAVTGGYDIAYGPTQNLSDLSTDWQLTFTATNKNESQPTLTDWIANPDTEFYSGEAVYSRDFVLPTTSTKPISLEIEGGTAISPPPLTQPEAPGGIPNPLITRPGPGMRAWYDPPVREAAIVYINGQRAGSLWHPPYRLDVTHLLKPGQNHIEIPRLQHGDQRLGRTPTPRLQTSHRKIRRPLPDAGPRQS